MVQNGCPSLRDPKAFHVIKTLGGYSQLVVRCIDEALARLAHNPRGKRVSEFANRILRSKVGELRTQVQTMLSRISLPKAEIEVRTGTTAKGRWPLSTGVYSEIELRAQEIAWKGTIDLLVVTAADCTITDFKTGKRDDCHHFQLSVYALLWHRDRELNPSRRLIDRLRLTYLDEAIEYVAPGLEELEALEDEITERTAAASFSVASIPPEARPTPDNCHYCNVRHLCPEYWTAIREERFRGEAVPRQFGDVEIVVTGMHGPSSWDAQISASQFSISGKSAVVRTNGYVKFTPGARIRVLDVGINMAAEQQDQPVVLTCGALSEFYLVSG
jgi:hypothetical protein